MLCEFEHCLHDSASDLPGFMLDSHAHSTSGIAKLFVVGMSFGCLSLTLSRQFERKGVLGSTVGQLDLVAVGFRGL